MSKLEEGKKLFEDDKFEEALACFSDFLSNNTNHGDALFYRGLCYRKIGNFQDSVNDLTALIEKLPDEATLYSERGVSHYHLKDYNTALKDMDKAVELEPKNSYRYSSRAYIKAYVDIDGAIEDYEQATIIDPKDEIAYNNLGLLLEKRGKLKAAQEKFKRSNEIIGYNPNKRGETENSVEFGDVDNEIVNEVDGRINKAKASDTSNTAKYSNQSIGKVMLNVFTNKKTRKEYFQFLKNIFKKST